MFCPKCGNPDQSAESYCRRCGIFLPDLSKPIKTTTPEQHMTANTVLSSMTIVASFTLSILLWVILGFRSNTHPLIYVTAGLLFAMGCWHIQTLWRTLLLRKHLKKSRPPQEAPLTSNPIPDKLLEQADFENMVPASVTDHTTKNLSEIKSRSS